MGANTEIGWTDHSLNFWTGCEKISPGCKFCYMYRGKERWHKDPREVVKTNLSTVMAVLNKAKPGDRIFALSWSDFFIEEADKWREEAWNIIRNHPQFTWQILTKRTDRISACLPPDWGNGWDHVHLGFSAENQEMYNKRIVEIQKVKSKIIWVSIEPMLELIDLMLDGICQGKLQWAVVGGESGNDTGKYRYRPCEEEWIISIVDQCRNAKVPVFVKQMETHLAKAMGLKDRSGSKIKEFPEYLQVQQFPK